MKKQKTAPAESAVQTEKKGTGIQIDKKTVFGITALLLVIMLLAGVLTQVVPRGEYQMDDSGMVINGTYHEFAGDEGKMPWWKIILAPIMVFTSSQITTGIGIVVFIVLIGGTFLILDRSGVLKYIMSSVVRKFEKKKYLLLAVIVFVCMMMSSVVGVLEESLTLVPLSAIPPRRSTRSMSVSFRRWRICRCSRALHTESCSSSASMRRSCCF